MNKELQDIKCQVDPGLKTRETLQNFGYLALIGGLVAAVVYKTMEKAH